jgi:hypothetical protein
MNYFATIRSALDASLPGICHHYRISPADALQYVRRHLQTMNVQWFSGDAPNIAYHDPLCRFSYLYCHTAVNANLCEVAIRRSPDLVAFITDKMNNQQQLRVCAFGGGPGTELLALAKHLTRTRPQGPLASLAFTLLDRVPEWSESWNALEAQIIADFRARGLHIAQWPFTISKTFVPYDMTLIGNYANMPSLFQQDLYLMNYVVSEIIGGQANFQAVLSTAANSSPAGSKFLIVDRDQNEVQADAIRLLQTAGLTVGQVVATSANMDGDEQAAVLAPYSGPIGWQPRRQWGGDGRRGAFWVIGTKP